MRFILIKKKSAIKGIAFALVLVLICVGVSLTGAAQVWGGATSRKLPIYSVATDEKKVAISFDACWGNEKTAGILKVLEQQNVPANYFVVGSWAEKYSDDLKMLSDSGRVEIGTHSNTHAHMNKLSKKQIELELSTSSAIIENVTKKKVELFRAPYGEYSNTLLDVAKSQNIFTVQWDVDSLDWKDLSSNDMVGRILNNVQNGSIVLMHNDGKNTLAALPAIIVGLKNKGYQLVTIGDLIYRDNYSIDHTGRQIRR